MDQSTDNLDVALIRLLEEDARRPVAELARVLKTTRTTVQNRLSRLLDRRIIRRFTLELDDFESLRTVHALVLVRLVAKDSEPTISAIRRMNTVERLYTVSGQFDLIADLRASTAAELDSALAAIRKLPGVKRTESAIKLARKK